MYERDLGFATSHGPTAQHLDTDDRDISADPAQRRLGDHFYINNHDFHWSQSMVVRNRQSDWQSINFHAFRRH